MLESLLSFQVNLTTTDLAEPFRYNMDVVWLFIGLLIGNNLDYLRIDKEAHGIWKSDEDGNDNTKQIYCYLYRLYPVIVMLCVVGYYLFRAVSILLYETGGLGWPVLQIALSPNGENILVFNLLAFIICSIIPAVVFGCLLYVYLDNLCYLKANFLEIVCFIIFTLSCIICTICLIVSKYAPVFIIFGIIAIILYSIVYCLYNRETKRNLGYIKQECKKTFSALTLKLKSVIQKLCDKLKRMQKETDNKDNTTNSEPNNSIQE